MDNTNWLGLKLIPENIPAELRAVDQWVCWETKFTGNSVGKIPINPRTGGWASSTDPRTWADFETALAAYEESKQRLAGIGFVVTKEDRFIGLDFDHYVDPETGEIDPMVRKAVAYLGTYAEISPSGTGVRLIAEGSVPDEVKRTAGAKGSQKLEFWDSGRFLTITGHALNGVEVTAPGPEKLTKVIRAFGTPPKESTPFQDPREGGFSVDEAVADILSGDDLHAPLARLAAHFAATGVKPGTAREILLGILQGSGAKEGSPGRWETRMREIPGIVESAYRKFAKAAPEGVATLIPAVSIVPEPISWLWEGWLARSKLHIMAGPPEAGKTNVAIALAAAVTCGGSWPDGTSAEAGTVVIWTGEDGLKDVLVPRLIACGADMSRVYFVGPMTEYGERRPFDPAKDMPALREEFGKVNPDLFIVDSIVSAVSGDSHKNAETRRGLQPMVDLLEAHGSAGLGITHFTKGTKGQDPVERVTGSLAFGALPRIVMAVAKVKEDKGGGRIVVRAKSNIGPSGGGFAFDIQGVSLAAHPDVVTSEVLWKGPIEGEAHALLTDAENPPEEDDNEADAHAMAEAKDFLRAVLGGGPVPVKEVHAEAKDAAIAPRTLRRAKDALRVGSRKVGFATEGQWFWSLPDKGDQLRCPKVPDTETMVTLGGNGHLSGNPELTNTPLEGSTTKVSIIPKGVHLQGVGTSLTPKADTLGADEEEFPL